MRSSHAYRDVWHEFPAARVRHIMRHVVNRWLVDVGIFRRGEERGSSPRVDGKGGNCIDKFLLELDELVSRLDQGGRPVVASIRKGFGSHLSERAFGGQLGRAELVFSSTGLSCTFEIA